MGVLIPTDQVLVRKNRKQGGGRQARAQRFRVANENRSLEELATEFAGPMREPPVKPKPRPSRAGFTGTPGKRPGGLSPTGRSLTVTPEPRTIKIPRIPNPYLAAGGVLAVAGGGAYLAHRQSQKRLGKRGYQRQRVEKSLSSMQPDFPSVMMSTT